MTNGVVYATEVTQDLGKISQASGDTLLKQLLG